MACGCKGKRAAAATPPPPKTVTASSAPVNGKPALWTGEKTDSAT